MASASWSLEHSALLGRIMFAYESLKDITEGADLDLIENDTESLINSIEEANENRMSEEVDEEEDEEEEDE